MSKKGDKQKAIAYGISIIGIAIFILTAGKISSEASIAILLFFEGAGAMLAYFPKESERIVKVVADIVIEIIGLFGQIIIGILKAIRDRFTGG